MPLQISGIGMPVALQTSLPFVQTNVPAEQVPSPLPHFSPTPGSMPSSIMPLQSSSMPLQTSTPGVMVGALQTVPLPSALQMVIPVRWQAPFWPLSQAAPTLNPSSISPLQLLSRPSQISAGTGQQPGPPHALG